MKRALIVCSVVALAGCAAEPTREQSLVNRAADAMGGAERLAGIKTVSARGTTKQWEPEQSEVPGGEMRFANETSFAVVQDRTQGAARTDIERRFAYPTPRTFKFAEVVLPDTGYVLGVDSNGRNAQSQKMSPPAHSMSSLRLAAVQREALRSNVTRLVLAMQANPGQVRPALDIVANGVSYPAVGYGPFTVAFDPRSGLPARMRTLDYDNIWGDVTYDAVFSDWRDFGGVRVPMHRDYELNGRVVQAVQLTDFQANVPVDSAAFAVPAELKADAAKPAQVVDGCALKQCSSFRFSRVQMLRGQGTQIRNQRGSRKSGCERRGLDCGRKIEFRHRVARFGQAAISQWRVRSCPGSIIALGYIPS